MSRQVEQHTTLRHSDDFNSNDDGAKVAMEHIQAHEQQPAFEIKESEISFVSKECLVDRNGAIELITMSNGNVEEALRLYVNQ